MPIGRRTGGAPRWTNVLGLCCAAALLFVLTVFYLAAVHVRTAVDRFTRDASIPRSVHDIPYADLINTTAAAHHLSPTLLAAMVMAESGFDPQAHSRRGAYGLMQVMPATWREIGTRPACVPDIARLTTPPCMDDPASNLEVGTRYLRRLVDRFEGNVVLAVAAYNAGARTVAQHGGVPPYPETNRYLREVALAWLHLEQDGTLTPFWLTVIRTYGRWPQAWGMLVLSLTAVGDVARAGAPAPAGPRDGPLQRERPAGRR